MLASGFRPCRDFIGGVFSCDIRWFLYLCAYASATASPDERHYLFYLKSSSYFWPSRPRFLPPATQRCRHNRFHASAFFSIYGVSHKSQYFLLQDEFLPRASVCAPACHALMCHRFYDCWRGRGWPFWFLIALIFLRGDSTPPGLSTVIISRLRGLHFTGISAYQINMIIVRALMLLPSSMFCHYLSIAVATVFKIA